MEIKYDKLAIVINRMRRDELPEYIETLQEATNADYIIGLPDNQELADIAESGDNIQKLSADNPVIVKLDDLLGKALSDKQ